MIRTGFPPWCNHTTSFLFIFAFAS